MDILRQFSFFLKKMHYLRNYGAEPTRHTQKVLALRLVSPDATRSDRVGFVGARHACTDAYGWRKVDNIPTADTRERWLVYRGNTSYRPDERPSRCSA